MTVSTHSRAKAAGFGSSPSACASSRFNSQPREGGWAAAVKANRSILVSTHSRAKAAGPVSPCALLSAKVSTHSRAKAAGKP